MRFVLYCHHTVRCHSRRCRPRRIQNIGKSAFILQQYYTSADQCKLSRITEFLICLA